MNNEMTSSYVEHAKFCQPFLEYMIEVVVIVKARRLNLNMLENQLRQHIDQVRTFSLESSQKKEAVDEAIFAICAWTDEHIMNAGWQGVSELWPQVMLQMQYFNTNLAGDLFFERMDSLTNNTCEARGVYAFCLLNGFKGKYVYSLSIEELEFRRQQAVSNALVSVGLMDHRSETFPSLEQLVEMRIKPQWKWQKYLPVVISLLVLAIFSLILAAMLQLNATNILVD